ncbi:serine/threonine-protein kinase HipA [Runella defluvii]|uniref:Serine/threonine-protein kinase HipA n=1 Tax=Runella defluvii TaxID=370973 RepID=A0A7W5ZUN6_9BACT|nr:HipA domain-containing protein [Runella defluvii]MBB3841872.1 serine/threonine-protein kinase HipA [Runella defluvii]
MKTIVCPSTLQSGFDTFSPKARKSLFGGKQVSPILPFKHQDIRTTAFQGFGQSFRQLSISGVQEKYGLVLDSNTLRLPKPNEQTKYILKPIPPDLPNASEIPANEHLTMQIAQQVYSIPTAANGLIFFADEEPALLIKRFDFRPDGSKWRQEDFASLSGRTKQTAGLDYKYEGSYEEVAQLIKQHLPAYRVETEKFFRLLLFNYLFSNGDAHLKNFSIVETLDGDFVLSPAYDLICTRLHLTDSDMALKDGLFSNDYETDSYTANAFYAFDDFLIFGSRIGIAEKRVRQQLVIFQKDYEKVRAMTQNSWLSDAAKATYLACYESRLKRLNYAFKMNR